MLAISIEHNLSQEKLNELGVSTWAIWTKEISEFSWYYDEREQFYLLEGSVIITPDDGDPIEIKVGDFVTCAEGLSCRWQVLEPVRKYYQFG